MAAAMSTDAASRPDHDDQHWMDHALRLAERGTGMVSPNPRVGCVIVDRGTVLSEGWHAVFGGPHAEAMALQACTAPTTVAITDTTVLYVTLEPCNHYGKTPPCAEAIIRSGIRHVVVAVEDPHPVVAGTGIAYLRSHGIDVRVGVRQQQATWLNRFFFRHATTGLPYVAVKTAESRDGFMAPNPKRRLQMTGPASQRAVHQLRAEFDAVLTSAATILIDNPQLNVRDVQGRNPVRVIIDATCSTPDTAHVIRTARHQRTIMVLPSTSPESDRQPYVDAGCDIVLCELQQSDGFDLHEVMLRLGQMGIASILCEAGPELSSAVLATQDTMEWYRFIAAMDLHDGYALAAPLTADHRSVDTDRWFVHHHLDVYPDDCAVYLSRHLLHDMP